MATASTPHNNNKNNNGNNNDADTVWFWKTDDESWELYSEADRATLEQALHAGETSVMLMDTATGIPKYECHLAQVPMKQENLQTNHTREICRGWPEQATAAATASNRHRQIARTRGPAAAATFLRPVFDGDSDSDDDEEDEEDEDDYSSDGNNNNSKLPDHVRKLMEEVGNDPTEMVDAAPPSFICSLSCGIMREPAMTMVGSTYEKVMIQQWLATKKTDPLTNQYLTSDNIRVIDNRALKDAIQSWRENYEEEQKQKKKQQEEEDSKPPAKPKPTTTQNGATSPTQNDTTTINTISPVARDPGVAAASNNDSSGDLEEGESRQVSSHTNGDVYTIKLIRGVYSCSCPAWIYQGGPIDRRSCKHLKEVRGTVPEAERTSGNNNTNKRKRTVASLDGKTICFTGALRQMTRAKAHALAQECGAVVHMSVTRNTDILVVGRRPGMKVSKGDESDRCELWEEDDFVAATENGAMTSTTATTATTASNRRSGGAGGNSDDQDASIPAKIMLAHSYKKDNRMDPTGWLMSEKLDGMRAWWDGHTRKLWSRQGKAIYAPDWWLQSLPPDIILDGELWLGRGKFQECMSIVRRQDRPQTWNEITFVVFDAPDGTTVFDGYEERYKKAEEALKKVSAAQQFAKLHPYEICDGKEHVKSKLEELEQQGAEGLMLRKPGSLYRGGRSNDLLKVKSSRDDEAVVASHEVGRGRHGGRLGAVHVVNRAGKRFKVGSGFTDAQREDPPPVGSVITYRYNELTNSGIPRFPVFVRIRPDVSAADVQAGHSSASASS
ncbi:U-box domain-containing protein [Seminavis robusta]|uniref:U-box domain-containing protein n=1 Tax=Seminavis robusta TaxID=568900 RepID=A0A9N8E4Z7_9STRA|nr:U-box domain-containing protein [Seminavis robusta]|eukprot:Sro525_g160110.1 U-box domain-containing protein (783) ;mRNA; r:16507-18855